MSAPPLPPLSLYIHVPWCRRKCAFCDLESRGLRGALPARAYVEAVVSDLRYAAAAVRERPVCSIFFGGGTPGLLPTAGIGTLLDAAARHLRLAPEVEVSLELHPLDITAKRLAGYRAAGVNRLSIGVQSFDDAALAALGRPYDGNRARAALRQAGTYCKRLNLDLMYGLPGQSPAAALDDLRRATALEPEHLSWYPLSLQPGTPWHRRPPPGLPGEDTLAAMETQGQACLARGGYERYELCAYARPGGTCRHNLNYWEYGDYLGIGAGAHGKLSQARSDRITRERRLPHPGRYMAAAGGPGAIAERQEPDACERALEFLMGALRLCSGFALHRFTERTGVPLSAIHQRLRQAAAAGLLRLRHDRAQPTPRGLDLHNDLVLLCAPEPSPAAAAPATATCALPEPAGQCP